MTGRCAAQYWLFMDRLLHGNLGTSLIYGAGASTLIWQRLPVTLWLIVYATVLAILISVPLAMIAATRKDGLRDHAVRAVPLIGLGMPPFWVGFLLIYVFGIQVHWFPVSGYGQGFFGHLRSMFLPAADRGDRAVAGGHPQPASQHAQRARRRLHHHGQVQGRGWPPAVLRGTCCATRSSRRSPCSASTSAS